MDLSSLKPPKRPFVIVFGNEGDGLSQDVVDLAHEKVRIESVGQVDSFNVGVSVGIVGYWLKMQAAVAAAAHKT